VNHSTLVTASWSVTLYRPSEGHLGLCKVTLQQLQQVQNCGTRKSWQITQKSKVVVATCSCDSTAKHFDITVTSINNKNVYHIIACYRRITKNHCCKLQSGTKTSQRCFCHDCIKYDDFHYSFTR